MNKYSSYRSEMVSTDGRTDTEGYNIIPRHTLVAGYNQRGKQCGSGSTVFSKRITPDSTGQGGLRELQISLSDLKEKSHHILNYLNLWKNCMVLWLMTFVHYSLVTAGNEEMLISLFSDTRLAKAFFSAIYRSKWREKMLKILVKSK